MKRGLALILSLLMLISCMTACNSDSSSAAGNPQKKENNGKMTIMMYVVGSDLESSNGNATKDFREIVNSDLDVDNINFLIYTGGAKSWQTNISADVNSTYIIESEDGKKRIKLLEQSTEYLDMASPSTLSGFINYASENYPADKYGLILWNHGGGPSQGYGYDERTEKMMPVSDLANALGSTTFKGDNKLDFIGFDACLMGSVEVATALKDYSNYLIASEETEPDVGWDYSFLSDVKADSDTENFAKALIDCYYEKNQESSSPLYRIPFTLSCADLNKVDTLNTAIDALFGEFNNLIKTPQANELLTFRKSVYSYGCDDRYPEYQSDLIDIGALADTCAGSYQTEADNIKSALNDYIVYSKSDIQPAYGATIYYPYSGIGSYLSYGCNTYTQFTSCPSYVKFIGDYTSILYRNYQTDSDSRSVSKKSVKSLKDVEVNGKTIKVKLPEKQRSTVSKAYVNVLKKGLTDGDLTSYTPVTLNQRIEPNKNGELEVNADFTIPVIESDGKEIIWPMRMTQSLNGTTYYQSISSYVAASGYEAANTVMEPVIISSKLKDGETELSLTGMYYLKDNQEDAGKNSINADEWNSISDYEIAKYEQYTSDGALLPFSDWEKQGAIQMHMMDYSTDFSIGMKSLDKLESSKYCYQIVIEDLDGNCYSSDLVECGLGVEVQSESEKTSSGELTYSVYSDHAEVTKYSGTDKTLKIPAKFKNVPVTKVCSSFFDLENKSAVDELIIESPDTVLADRSLYHANVKQVTLPDGVKEIAPRAFYSSYVERVKLPGSLEKIGDKAFANCERLVELSIPSSVKKLGVGVFAGTLAEKEITIDSGNKDYKIVDKSLLSADGKVLYARFDGKDTYQVPDGVETIARYACVGDKFHGDRNINDHLKSVTIPDSVKYIQSDAFRDNNLTELTIPDSVISIANGAFNNYANSGASIKKLKIGKGLEYLGKGAFDGITVVSVEVSEDNEHFSSSNGKLMNKAGDAELKIGKQD